MKHLILLGCLISIVIGLTQLPSDEFSQNMNHIMIDESDLDLGDDNDGSLDNKHTIGEMDSSDIMAYSGEISGLNHEMEVKEN